MSCKACETEESEEKGEKIKSLVLLIVGTAFLLIAIVLQKLDATYGEISWEMFSDPGFYSSYAFIAFLFYTIGYFPLLFFAMKDGIGELKEGNRKEDNLNERRKGL